MTTRDLRCGEDGVFLAETGEQKKSGRVAAILPESTPAGHHPDAATAARGVAASVPGRIVDRLLHVDHQQRRGAWQGSGSSGHDSGSAMKENGGGRSPGRPPRGPY